ncbi:MAG TPA: Rne/Rng family ribonuclease [Paracoccus sp. (in: a-proteobacteria)]|nr:Rne/Rng family ribonuclease [Paracoccus sp. (in: a-proteobacteria)]
MAKKMLIDATHPEETRVVVVDGTKVEEFDFETVNKRQIAGNIYLAKVTRVEPSLQAAFVDYGGNRHGFLAFAEIHPDYYQIPAADRKALIEEDRVAAEAAEAEDNPRARKTPNRGNRNRAERADSGDAVTRSEHIPGMEVIETADESEAGRDRGDDAAALEGIPAAQAGNGDSPEAVREGLTPDEIAAAAQDAEAPEESGDAEAEGSGQDAEGEESGDHADDGIESVADEDVAEEISTPRKPRGRRYKIQEVIKVRQIMLVQVVKEERGNKGAALTTYLSLAGRYCVLMPNTARGGGISRKITNVADRKKLKEIASELEVPQGAGLIIRTAGSQRTRTEIRRDYEYLMRLWEQIRELTFKSIAPAPIYEEGDLIKRTIRDLYSKDIDEVLVEGERGYRTARDFMKMIMPSHARSVKQYTDPMPLFARYQVEGYLGGMFNPVVQLKSGGYIVIGVTEALVAIDVNSGRATKEGSIEDTAYKTNCEAADEIARQLRLRDLAGLIVIDFIDMDERKNNAAVEKRFKERLKTDRARIQVGRISGFGLMEMSRQRLRPGMLESTTQPCAHCHGTGLIRSDDSMALTILRAIEEEGTRKRSREVLVRAPVAVANFLMNHKREHIGMIEARYGMAVRVEAAPELISPDYTLEKFKTATRNVPEPASSHALSVDASLMAQIDDEEDLEDEAEDDTGAEADDDAADRADAEAARTEGGDENGDGRARRRRRRRRRNGRANGDDDETGNTELDGEAEEGSAAADESEATGADEATVEEPAAVTAAEAGQGDSASGEADSSEAATGERPRRSRRRVRRTEPATGEDAAAEPVPQPVVEESRAAPAGEGVAIASGAAADAGSAAEETIVALQDAVAPDMATAQEVPTAEDRPEAAAESEVWEDEDVAEAPEDAAVPVEEAAESKSEAGTVAAEPKAEALDSPAPEAPAPEAAQESQASASPAPDTAAEDVAVQETSARPKRRGWWSVGG